MIAKMFNIDQYIIENNIQEITNPIFLNTNRTPTENGLFSYEIFGKPGSRQRKEKFGYIKLGIHLLHPLAYKIAVAVQRNVQYCITGQKTFKIDPSGILVNDPKGNTGIMWLYKNWNKIKFQPGDSEIRKSRLEVLKLYKDDIWIDKWLVIPAAYRDLNWSKIEKGRIAVDELNDLYVKLISFSSLADNELGSLFSNSISSANSAQQTIVAIYEYLTKLLKGKNGLLKKALLGKNIEYSTRGVISCKSFRDSFDDEKISFKYSGIPIAMCCSLFFPFLTRELANLFSSFFEKYSNTYTYSGKVLKIHEDAYLDFTALEMEKRIKMFIKSPAARLEKITIRNSDNKMVQLPWLSERLKRDTTWLDVMFIVLSDILEDKHVYITRYPVEHFQNIFVSRIRVLTTTYTKKFDKYKFFPDLDKPVEFIDSIQMSNSYLQALGADFDGDTVSVRGIFTQEANIEAEEIMIKKSNLVNGVAEPIRTCGNEAILSLYSLTKE